MKQEDKELLLKDLCARLPYKVKCECSPINFRGRLGEISHTYKMCRLFDDFSDENVYIYDCRPYLFPMSSMSKGQKEELDKLTNGSVSISESFFYDLYNCSKISTGDIIDVIDWLNKNHIDYRGLIKKELAIDCTNLNIY